MKLSRKIVCAAALVLAAANLCFAGAGGEKTAEGKPYPGSTPIQFIVNKGPGGGSDTMTRYIASSLERVLGCTTVVVNKPGGDGVVGTNDVYKAAPDGYTLVVTAPSEIAYTIVNGTGVNYNENGFTVIAGLNVRGSILALKKGSAIHSVNDLIRIAKEKPGSVTVGIPGGGNKQQAVDLMKTLGVELTIVNAGNGNDLFTQVLGGHIEMGLIGAQFYQRFIDEGCEIIAQTVEVREDGVKSVPTLSELGYRMVADNRMFLGGPAGLPDTVVQTLSDAVKKLFADPVFVDGMRKMGETPKYMDTAELAAYHAQYYKTEIPKLKAAKGAAK